MPQNAFCAGGRDRASRLVLPPSLSRPQGCIHPLPSEVSPSARCGCQPARGGSAGSGQPVLLIHFLGASVATSPLQGQPGQEGRSIQSVRGPQKLLPTAPQ